MDLPSKGVILEKPPWFFGDRKELHGINGNLRMICRYLHILDYMFLYIFINKIVVSKTKSFLAIFPDCCGR